MSGREDVDDRLGGMVVGGGGGGGALGHTCTQTVSCLSWNFLSSEEGWAINQVAEFNDSWVGLMTCNSLLPLCSRRWWRELQE